MAGKLASLFSALLLAAACSNTSAMAASSAVPADNAELLPVLVKVDRNGRLIEASPQIRLTQKAQVLLENNLAQILKNPERSLPDYTPGGQFIVNMELEVTGDEQQKYAHFVLVSTQPANSIAAFWNRSPNSQFPGQPYLRPDSLTALPPRERSN